MSRAAVVVNPTTLDDDEAFRKSVRRVMDDHGWAEVQYLHLMLAVGGLPARCEQFRVIGQELAQFVQAALLGQPPGQVMQSVRVTRPGAPPPAVTAR